MEINTELLSLLRANERQVNAAQKKQQSYPMQQLYPLFFIIAYIFLH